MSAPQHILVIKLGALGDFIQALGSMAAIRRHHAGARITLLTTAPFESLARESGYFDSVLVDSRPRWSNLAGWLALARRLNAGQFSRVYDLQNNDRTGLYFRLLRRPKPEWVGAARGASHRNAAPQRTTGNAFDGHVQTLALAGITGIEIDPLAWIKGDATQFALPHPYVLLVPGSAPSRPEKRWPAHNYGVLARTLDGWGYTPVIIGTVNDAGCAALIRGVFPGAIDLTGKTALADIVLLARSAAAAIGNDTGPMHLIAATGCPCTALFSRHSNAARHAPLGRKVDVITAGELAELSADDLIGRLRARDFRAVS